MPTCPGGFISQPVCIIRANHLSWTPATDRILPCVLHRILSADALTAKPFSHQLRPCLLLTCALPALIKSLAIFFRHLYMGGDDKRVDVFTLLESPLEPTHKLFFWQTNKDPSDSQKTLKQSHWITECTRLFTALIKLAVHWKNKHISYWLHLIVGVCSYTCVCCVASVTRLD